MGGVVWSRAVDSPPEGNSDVPLDLQAAVAENSEDEYERKQNLAEDMKKFREEIDKKREARKEAIKNLNKRISDLEEEKCKQVEENAVLKEALVKLRDGTELRELRERLKSLENQPQETSDENGDGIDQRDEPDDKDEVIEGLERQVKALKDVATIGGEMLKIRELQVNELKSKLEAIEETGAAYEKEVENMKKLRNLYEERTQALVISHQMELEREQHRLTVAEARQKVAEQKTLDLEEKNKEQVERMNKIEKELDEAKEQISDLKIKLAGKCDDLYNVTSQMAVVNHLFGRLFSPGQDSLEKITKVLEEHHDLVNHLTANGKINDLASTLVEIADKDPLPASEGTESDMSEHLSKVWRLLVELLGHHMKPVPEEAPPESCYKSVDTPTGPKLVISVSQTFLRLKDLILEKNSLMKEVGRLKDLNSTLESRLLEQESRLTLVAAELHTTWSVVNKLKRQHQNLHTSEQVLRYELAQKRLLLNDLKKKLEECKENWTLARAKNNQTEKDWKLLRTEFASRKQQTSSAESGYEESPTDSQDEEDNWKEDKNENCSSSSEDDQACVVLDWAESGDESRTDQRRGTLTEVESRPEGSQEALFLNFSVEDDACTVLPWTDPEEGVIGGPHPPDSTPVAAIPGNSGLVSRDDSQAGPSGASSRQPETQPRTAEQILQARQDRLKRLEEGCKGLFNKMSQTNQRSDLINSRLTELHEIYGEDRSRRRPEDAEPETRVQTSVQNEPASTPTPPPFPQTPLYLPRTQNPNVSNNQQGSSQADPNT